MSKCSPTREASRVQRYPRARAPRCKCTRVARDAKIAWGLHVSLRWGLRQRSVCEATSLRFGEQRGRTGDVAQRGKLPQRAGPALEVAVQERERDPLHDRELWLLDRVRRQVFGAEQAQAVLRPGRGFEEGVRPARRVDRVRRALDREERRTCTRKCKGTDTGNLRARKDDRVANSGIAEAGV